MMFEIIRTRTIYQGNIFTIKQEVVQLPTGSEKALDIVSHHGAVVILPVDDVGNIWFVRQYRHAAGKELLELPAGTLEDGENPVCCTMREIREEIGMAANSIKKIGEFYIAPGYSTEYLYVFLATTLTPDPLPMDEDELISVEKIPVRIAYKHAEAGQIIDAKTLAALFLGKSYIYK